MEFHPALQEAVLVRRYKRFLADVQLPDGSELTLHCPNTGAMTGCAEPGSRVWYSTSDNPSRKYPHTFELVETVTGDLACVNTGRANTLVYEALLEGHIPGLAAYDSVRREVRFGSENSRVDFLLENRPQDPRPCYVEVKSVTLGLPGGQGLFPDAVSVRGTRHLRELTRLVEEGCRAVLLFCVQHTGIQVVSPAADIDPQYTQTLAKAVESGVEVMAWKSHISPRLLVLDSPCAFSLHAQG